MNTNTQPSSSEESKFNFNSPDRETKWSEVKVACERIKKFAVDATTNLEITRDSYYELYNMTVGLLRNIDGLDPDRRQRETTTNSNSFISNIANPNFPQVANYGNASSSEFATSMQTGGSFNLDQFFPTGPAYLNPGLVPMQNYYPSNIPGSTLAPRDIGNTKDTRFRNQNNFTGELYLDVDGPTTDPKQKRRRRRTFYAPKRNLHCHMCKVTETPEWRRGPDGDHTLCNACGLHYAKTQKKDTNKDNKSQKRGKKKNLKMKKNV